MPATAPSSSPGSPPAATTTAGASGSLPKVPQEIAAIRDAFGGEVLLDEGFQGARFERAVVEEEPTVVHIASHAYFGSGPEDSFLLTSDGAVTFDELGEVVGPRRYTERPLELLVLSACETAQGDDQAALGLAGVAVRSGARAAVGSLWTISDDATYEVMTEFYGALDQAPSKAQALRPSTARPPRKPIRLQPPLLLVPVPPHLQLALRPNPLKRYRGQDKAKPRSARRPWPLHGAARRIMGEHAPHGPAAPRRDGLSNGPDHPARLRPHAQPTAHHFLRQDTTHLAAARGQTRQGASGSSRRRRRRAALRAGLVSERSHCGSVRLDRLELGRSCLRVLLRPRVRSA